MNTNPGLAVQAGTVPLVTNAAVAAERNGLPAFWTSEFYDRSSVVTLAAAAAATSRIRLGSSVTWAFGRTPITLATDFRSLSEIAPGRITLGLGTGNSEVVSDWHGLDEKQPVSRLIELVRLIRAIWSADERPVEHDGPHYRCHLAADSALPPMNGNRPPVFLAGGRNALLRAAGAVADGLIGMPVWSRPFVEEIVRPRLAAAGEQAGRDGQIPVTGMTICAVDDASDRARLVAATQVAVFAMRPSADTLIEFHGFQQETTAIREAARRRDFRAMAGAVSDRMLDAFAVYGTPAEARERYQANFDGLYDDSLLFASGKGLPLAGFSEGLLAICEAFAPVPTPGA
jgi:alkanesulfonate monooxygenase SsuD/methylene tetrahydromethanopterin reductase-like flavin-dependent oxidoreductase (luciferase family)